MQVAVIEFARNVLGWGSKSYTHAHSLSHSHSLELTFLMVWDTCVVALSHFNYCSFFDNSIIFIKISSQSYTLNCVHLLLFVSHQVPTQLNSMQTLNDQW